MDRNAEVHFSQVPQVELNRSKFKRNHTHKTTLNAGDLIPIYVDKDIMPGDTVKMDFGMLLREQTPLFPVMDEAYIDLFFFFIPHRLVWNHWKAFWGENEEAAWTQTTEYTEPQIKLPPLKGWDTGSIADYMGIPVYIPGGNVESVSALPFRAYCQVINDWFCDENLVTPIYFAKDETTITGQRKDCNDSGTAEEYDQASMLVRGGKPFKVAKFHDYFTSCLPDPQKGEAVTIGMSGMAPIKYAGDDESGDLPTLPANTKWIDDNKQTDAYIRATYNSNIPMSFGQMFYDNDGSLVLVNPNSTTANEMTRLIADLSRATATTINQLREAFAIQTLYEARARYGTRYIETIRGIFGVQSPDARLQRSELLGSKRIRINMDQVLQTSATEANMTPQGNTAAFSCTANGGELFTSSFTEHGTLLGLACIRTKHTYQQGLERMWSRKEVLDYYVPQLANLGEQAVLNKEIYLQTGSEESTVNNETFGFQERWAEYRYKPDRISGELRSNSKDQSGNADSLDFMHYGDDYEELPTLTADWIEETEENVNRTIAVTSGVSMQYFADFYFEPIYTRPMPMYSIPGLGSYL